MKPRQAALVKDLGRLLTKYDARDWQPLVRLLTSNPRLLFDAISAAGSKSSKLDKIRPKKGAAGTSPQKNKASAKSKVTAQKRSKGAATKAKSKRGGGLKQTASDLGDLVYRRALSRASISDLQALYLRAYRNKQVPKRRTELTAALDKYLWKLPQQERAQLLMPSSSAQSDPTEPYRRWVDIISKSAVSKSPRDTNG